MKERTETGSSNSADRIDDDSFANLPPAHVDRLSTCVDTDKLAYASWGSAIRVKLRMAGIVAGSIFVLLLITPFVIPVNHFRPCIPGMRRRGSRSQPIWRRWTCRRYFSEEKGGQIVECFVVVTSGVDHDTFPNSVQDIRCIK